MCVTGPAIHIPAKVPRDKLEYYRLQVEEQLLKVTAAAEKWAATGRRPQRESFGEQSRQRKASA